MVSQHAVPDAGNMAPGPWSMDADNRGRNDWREMVRFRGAIGTKYRVLEGPADGTKVQ